MLVPDEIRRTDRPWRNGSHMHYKESREQSAEFFRAALARMSAHVAALNPTTFAVWYEYVAQINPSLQERIDRLLGESATIDDEVIAQLYLECVGEPDEVTLRRASQGFRQLLSEVSQGTSHADGKAALLSERLVSFHELLKSGSSVGLAKEAAQTMVATTDMRASAESMRRLLVASLVEIEHLHRDLNRARTQSLTDGLTGLHNRQALDDALTITFAARDRQAEQVTLIMFDIDRFKAINDYYGHVMGDRVLQSVALALRDSVGTTSSLIARYGGEEFAVLLKGCDAAEGGRIAESCRQRVQSLRIRDRRTQAEMLRVTVSAGVAQYKSGEDAHTFVGRADAALYDAKHAGRNQIRIASR